jgi:hypothetical protein
MGNVIHYQDAYDKLVMEYNNNLDYLDNDEAEYLMQSIHKLEEWNIKDESNRRKGLYSKKNIKKERKEDY